MSKTDVATSHPVGETTPYKAVSLFAVLGLLCAMMYAIVVLMWIIAAWFQGTPPTIPEVLLPALYGLAGIGGVLCLLALRRIHLSEGTLTGNRLAQVGLWLCMAGGLGYLAYHFGTGWAIQQQAQTFLNVVNENDPLESGFFDHMQKGNLNEAFLLTMPYYQRNVDPKNDQQMRFRFDQLEPKQMVGELTKFAQSPAVALLQMAKEKPQLQGIKSWSYDNGGYLVVATYRLDTPEMKAVFDVMARSTESKEPGKSRKWFIDRSKGGALRFVDSLCVYTTLGKNLKNARDNSKKYLAMWLESVQRGAKVDSRPKDASDWSNLKIPDGRMQFLAPLKDAIQGYFNGKVNYVMLMPGMAEFTPWRMERNSGKIRLNHPFTIMIRPDTTSEIKQYMLQGFAGVVSTRPLDPHKESDGAVADWRFAEFRITKISKLPVDPMAMGSKQ